MSSTDSEQTSLMREILATLKTLQLNQTQLASNVDAIEGRVNILASIKEVTDAADVEKPRPSNAEPVDLHESHDHVEAPKSPSLTNVDGGTEQDTPSTTSASKKPTGTSRIILT
jgi:hypothetical protein